MTPEINQVLGIEKRVEEITRKWDQIPPYKVNKTELKHVAIICDGDRRSAVAKGLPAWIGHRLGVETIKGILRAGREWGIHTLTFWVWSTENWSRDQQQVDYIMRLAEENLAKREF